MLWHILWKNKNSFSLAFTLTFSLAGILWQKNPFSQGVSFLGKMTDRLSGALNASLEVPEILWVELDRYRDLEKKYSSALKQLEEYSLEKDRFDTLIRENQKLREQLGYDTRSEYPEIPATVLGIRINSISPRIIVNRGKRDGVAPFMPVIVRTHDQDGQLIRAVVGMVSQADSSSSIIQPINHPSFQLGVRVEETGHWAILNGNSGHYNEVTLSYLAESSTPTMVTHSSSGVQLAKGQRIVTSGSGGIFPPGIPVGYILRTGSGGDEFKTASARTYASMGRLESVIILKKHPEKWAIEAERDISWDQHLLTEFGEPDFPEPKKKETRTSPRQEKQSPSRADATPQVIENTEPEPPVERVSTGTGTSVNKPPVEEPTAATPEEEPEPARRINNITVPNPGGN